jgi:hypothetical protein
MVVVYFWSIKKRHLARALWHMGVDRLSLRATSVTFFKSLGTGKGETFTPSDADITRWGLLVVIPEEYVATFHNSRVVNSWRTFSQFEYRLLLKPISSHGHWSGKTPFAVSAEPSEKWNGPVAAITRARIKWHMNAQFWRAVPPVTTSLRQSTGLRAAIGIGEAPIGLQGTFSIWESAGAIREFAYQGAAHTAAIKATEQLNWYAEELFARFAVLEESGTLNTPD